VFPVLDRLDKQCLEKKTMKKIAIIFAIVGLIPTGAAYVSIEDLIKRYAEKEVSISEEKKMIH